MVDLTLFEIHLDGAEFTANAPGSNVGRSGSAEGDEPEDGGGGVSPLPILAAVGLLLVVAVVYRRLSGGSDESFEE